MLAFGLGSLALLSGCGSSRTRLSHDDYVLAVDRISSSSDVRDAERRFVTLAGGTICSGKPVSCRSLSRKECTTGSRSFARDVRHIVDAVARLDPPRDVEDLQARFLVASRRSADLLDTLADDVADGRVACGMPWNRRAYNLSSTVKAEHALADLAKRYKLRTGRD